MWLAPILSEPEIACAQQWGSRVEQKSAPRPRRRIETRGAHNCIPALDGLRAISICLVLAAHMLPLGPKSLLLNLTAGAMGMSLFFALSGFLIMRALLSDPVLEFGVKRLARILPLAYLYMALAFVISGEPKESLLAQLAFVLNYHPELITPLTAHLWSLCVEVQFYVAAALVFAALGRQQGAALAWPCCVAITVLRIRSGAMLEIPTHLRVDEILVGACIATAPSALMERIVVGPGIWLLSVGLWFAASLPESGALQYLRPYSAGLLLATTLIQSPGLVVDALGSRPLRYVATTSYAIYIIHPFTMAGWWNDGSVWERYFLKRPISMAATLAAAHVSTFYWERLWSRAARRWIDALRKSSRAAAFVHSRARFEEPKPAATALETAALGASATGMHPGGSGVGDSFPGP